ncbi:MAG: hypothetical protein ACOYMQ_13480 [Pseudanabaena sp.]|jgi:hypothetical protein
MARKAFSVTNIWSDSITVKSVATGKTYYVYYDGKIGVQSGDTVTIMIDDSSDKWKTIINERTGDAATINRVS